MAFAGNLFVGIGDCNFKRSCSGKINSPWFSTSIKWQLLLIMKLRKLPNIFQSHVRFPSIVFLP